ncbi:hypothetical protein AVEN_25359-1 [Araneus ventricosus]|uniref:Secreted protein n=1 Tax=Araneus ventricosus TaxID=182803 RepID=A0A4Y2EFY6_ARAVE|nr:hypothetical protein AVEN_25359-1 [Araneus ventricosus]
MLEVQFLLEPLVFVLAAQSILCPFNDEMTPASVGIMGTRWRSVQCGCSVLVVWSRHRARRAPGSKLHSTADPPCMEPVTRSIIRRRPNVLLLVWRGSLERGVPAQVSPLSSDHGSK